MLNSIIISMPYTKNNSRYSKNPPYNGFYSVLQHNNNYVAERTKEEKYMVKRRLKSVIAAVLVAAMLTTMAPQVVCKAAETAWEIVKNQETPLDEVYFDCKKSDDETKSYLYGYKDGKVVIMDSDYKLVKKTDYDEIASLKEKLNGQTAYIVSKKVGKEKKYGIISEKCEIIIGLTYSYIWSGDNAIQVTKKVDGKSLVGLISYTDGKQIVPCKYKSIESISKNDGNMLVVAIGSNGSSNAILNGKIILTKKKASEDDIYYFYFREYNGQKCILCRFVPKSGENNTKWSYYSYDGKLVKEMSNAEYKKNQNDDEDNENNISKTEYNEACSKWLDKACEDGKKHVEEFYKSNNVVLSNVESKSYYKSSGGKIKYYWNIITGEYKHDDYYGDTWTEQMVYSYIYNPDGRCLLSGRSFLNVAAENGDDEKKIYTWNERESRYLLNDDDYFCYLNKDNDNVEELFKLKSNLKNGHYFHYDHGNIVETTDNRIFIYKDKKVYSYDYKYGRYYFIANGSGVEMYQCGLSKEEYENLKWYEKEKYDGNIEWKYCGKFDIGIDELKSSWISEVEDGILVKNQNDGEMYYLGENKQYKFSYENLGVSKITQDGIADLGDKLYIYPSRPSDGEKILSIDKKTFETKVYTLDFDGDDEIVNLFMLDDNVYIQYKNDEDYYGVLDLSGKKYIDASKKEYREKFVVYGKYLYNYKENGGRKLYDSSLNSVGEYADVGEIYDSSKEDENGYYKEVDGLYKICVGSYRNMGGRFDEGYTIKLVIVDKNIGKVIYEVDDEAYIEKFTQIGKYYIILVKSLNSKTSKNIHSVIVDSTTGKQLYNGDGYIYVNESNNKVVIIKQSPYSVSTEKAYIKLEAGKSTKITYSAYNSKGKKVKAEAVSSNTKAVKVSVLSNNQIKIMAQSNSNWGFSYITLTSGNKKVTINVTVNVTENKVSKLKAKTKKVNVKKGKKSSLTYNYTAQDNKKSLTENVKISSSKKSIVKIVNKKLSNGKVTVGIKAVKKGTANITVKIGDKTATTKVVVK